VYSKVKKAGTTPASKQKGLWTLRSSHLYGSGTRRPPPPPTLS